MVTSKSGTPRSWLGFDGLVVALVALLFLVLTTGAGDHHDVDVDDDNDDSEQQQQDVCSRPPRRVTTRLKVLSSIPSALIVFLVGIFLCFLRDPSVFKGLKFGPSKISVLKITWEDWKIGFVRAAIPQIPLSILNSVIAVCKLSGDLFPDREASAMKVSVSVGIMNFVGCWFGAMPVCHGAGGLAGQYRFGGRSGLSVVFLGMVNWLLDWCLGIRLGLFWVSFQLGFLGFFCFLLGLNWQWLVGI